MDIKLRKITKNTLSILLAFAVLFSGLPILTGSAEANAASPYWKSYRAGAGSYSSTTVSWKKLTKKQRKSISGIAVFRGTSPGNLNCMGRINKSRTSLTNGASAGTRYCYQLKTYKTQKKRVKQYYNKTTKKWQTKKIKRAKTRRVKVTTYKYSHNSSLVWVSTPNKPTPPKPAPTTPTQPAKPGTVTGLKVSKNTNSIEFSWTKPIGNLTGFEIFLDGNKVCSTGSGVTSYTIKNLKSNTNYTIKVRSYLQINGKTAYGDFAQITVKTDSDAPAITDVTPAAITGLTVTSVTDNAVSITWDKLPKNVTGYEIKLDGSYRGEVGLNTNTYTIDGLNSDTAYDITVTAYYYGTKTNYGSPTSVTAVTTATQSGGNTGGNENPGTDNPGGDNTGGNTGSTFDYRDIPLSPNEIKLENGIVLSRYYEPDLVKLTDAWMAENLPSDATDAEKVNMCIKCMNELHSTPESLAIIDGWWYDNNCTTRALYFNTCAYSAGLVSSSRDCVDDENYGAPFISTHINNFVWVDGKGYIIDINNSRTAKPTLSLINYDWQNLHIITSNTKFDCRYY